MDSLMTTEAAAVHLAVKPATLARWRRLGRGPRCVRLGHKVIRYRAADVNRWLAKRLSKHVA